MTARQMILLTPTGPRSQNYRQKTRLTGQVHGARTATKSPAPSPLRSLRTLIGGRDAARTAPASLVLPEPWRAGMGPASPKPIPPIALAAKFGMARPASRRWPDSRLQTDQNAYLSIRKAFGSPATSAQPRPRRERLAGTTEPARSAGLRKWTCRQLRRHAKVCEPGLSPSARHRCL
jgi:hypothetical protein